MQKVELFKPEDFDGAECYSNFANKKLQKYLESCPVVYGYRYETGAIECKHHKSDGDNFKARLAFIEELPKPCKHEPRIISGKDFGVSIFLQNNTCRYCGVKLEAEWKEVK